MAVLYEPTGRNPFLSKHLPLFFCIIFDVRSDESSHFFQDHHETVWSIQLVYDGSGIPPHRFVTTVVGECTPF